MIWINLTEKKDYLPTVGHSNSHQKAWCKSCTLPENVKEGLSGIVHSAKEISTKKCNIKYYEAYLYFTIRNLATVDRQSEACLVLACWLISKRGGCNIFDKKKSGKERLPYLPQLPLDCQDEKWEQIFVRACFSWFPPSHIIPSHFFKIPFILHEFFTGGKPFSLSRKSDSCQEGTLWIELKIQSMGQWPLLTPYILHISAVKFSTTTHPGSMSAKNKRSLR